MKTRLWFAIPLLFLATACGTAEQKTERSADLSAAVENSDANDASLELGTRSKKSCWDAKKRLRAEFLPISQRPDKTKAQLFITLNDMRKVQFRMDVVVKECRGVVIQENWKEFTKLKRTIDNSFENLRNQFNHMKS